MPQIKSTSPRPRTGNRRNPLLHQAIIAAATEVLAKEGPTRFTIEAVAKLAGCGKPTIYRWWPSRSALLLEVYEQAVQSEISPPRGKDLAEDIATMLRQVWRVWRKESLASLYRLILSEMILEEEGARYLREVFFPRRQTLTVIAFQAAQDRGERAVGAVFAFVVGLVVADRVEEGKGNLCQPIVTRSSNSPPKSRVCRPWLQVALFWIWVTLTVRPCGKAGFNPKLRSEVPPVNAMLVGQEAMLVIRQFGSAPPPSNAPFDCWKL